MEDFSINKAHEQRRRAEAFLKQNKFDDSICCHQKAAELLADTIHLTTNVSALESLKLQIEYHQKQAQIIEKKKIYAQMELSRKSEQALNNENGDLEPANIEAIIFRTIEVHDSLINYLGKRGGDDNDILKSYSTSDTVEENENERTSQIVGNKHPKDDAQIIEELNVLSGQLRIALQTLVVQLDDRNKEIERLNTIIKTLEDEKQKAQDINNSSSKVVTDSSGGTSPYVFSPCSEPIPVRNLPPLEPVEMRNLPPLEPVEMPNYVLANEPSMTLLSDNPFDLPSLDFLTFRANNTKK